MRADCENFIHDWQDHYYGIECKNCKLLVPDGCGPWMPLEGPSPSSRDAKEIESDFPISPAAAGISGGN